MKAYSRGNVNSRGSAILTVMVVVATVGVLLGTIVSASLQRGHMANRLSDEARAIAFAEAGAHEAYSILVTNFNARSNDTAFPLTSYGSGSYDVDVIPVSNNMAVLVCTGICGDAAVSVILDVKDYGVDDDDSIYGKGDAFDYAMVSGGPFDFGGSGNISSTGGTIYIHSNQEIEIRGNVGTDVSIQSSVEIDISNNNTINGDVTAPVLDYTAGKVTITGDENTEAVPMVSIPKIDLTPFWSWATANGEVYDGLNLSGGTYTPVGGVMWVNGDVQISSDTIINGSIIATGDINFGGQASLVAPDNGFAMATRDGDIKFTTSGDVTGLVYAKNGDYEQNANGSLTGQVIVGGDIDKAGNSDVVVYEKTILTNPDGTEINLDNRVIGVSAWQK